MYNRLHSYFGQKKMLYRKQFGFRAHHSTDCALVELVDIIFDSCDKTKHTTGIFVDLSMEI